MRSIILATLVLVFANSLPAQSERYFTLNTTKVRPLAMGGAFTAIDDALAAIQFNPAAYFLAPQDEIPRVTFFLNPVSPFSGGVNHNKLFSGGGTSLDDLLITLSLLLKSMSFNFNHVQLGFLLGEESLSLPEVFFDDRLIRIDGFRQNHSHTVAGRLKLAEAVSVGAAANFIFSSSSEDPLKQEKDIGISYGVLLRPEKGLNIGVSFLNLPDSLSTIRTPLERLVDESVNIGVSYELVTKTMFSLDVRNLVEETNLAIREVHVGFEQVLLSHLALRGGYFKKHRGEHVFSWGLGLLNDSLLFSSQDEPGRNFYLNYAFVYEKSAQMDNRWHLLSFLIKI